MQQTNPSEIYDISDFGNLAKKTMDENAYSSWNAQFLNMIP